MSQRKMYGYGAMRDQHTLGSGEVNDVSVLFEHVHLLNRLDGLHVQLL